MPSASARRLPDDEDLARLVTSQAEALVRLWDRAEDWSVPRLSPAQIKVLTLLRFRGPMNLTSLAREFGAIPSSTSRLCDRLEAAGLLARSVPPDNRREVVLRVSREGLRRLEAFDVTRREDFAAVLDRMDSGDTAALVAGLAAFASAAMAITDESAF